MTISFTSDRLRIVKDAIGDWPRDQFYEDQIADDYMPDIIQSAFRPYGYRYVDDIEYSYKQVKD